MCTHISLPQPLAPGISTSCITACHLLVHSHFCCAHHQPTETNACPLDINLHMQAAEKTAGKGKSIGPAATSSTPVTKPVLHPSPAKSPPGQWKTKPTAVVSGVATSKAAMAKAGADALALMPLIPTAPAMTQEAPAGGGGTAQGRKPGGGSTAQHHNADASTASKQGPPQRMSTASPYPQHTVHIVCIVVHTALLKQSASA